MSVGVTLEWSGLDPVPNPHIDDEVIAAWIEERLNDGRNTFIRHMSGSHSGRTYRRGKSGSHTASAPGDWPATDSGRLASSTDYQMTGPREGTLGSDIEYAVYLTLGTYKMGPRQMYQEALQEVMDQRPAGDELAKAVTLDTGGPV